MPPILPRERWPEPQLSLPPSLASERIRILREYFRRGAEDSEFHFGYCYISWQRCTYRVAHSVPKHRLGANECGSVYYQADRSTATVFREVGSLLLWSAAVEGTVGRRGCKAGVAIGGEMRATLYDMDFLEFSFPRTPVHKGRLRVPLLSRWNRPTRYGAQARR